jgi:hypothetical protein
MIVTIPGYETAVLQTACFSGPTNHRAGRVQHLSDPWSQIKRQCL